MPEVPDYLLIQPEQVVHCQMCGKEMVFFYPFPDVLPDLCDECEQEEEE